MIFFDDFRVSVNIRKVYNLIDFLSELGGVYVALLAITKLFANPVVKVLILIENITNFY